MAKNSLLKNTQQSGCEWLTCSYKHQHPGAKNKSDIRSHSVRVCVCERCVFSSLFSFSLSGVCGRHRAFLTEAPWPPDKGGGWRGCGGGGGRAPSSSDIVLIMRQRRLALRRRGVKQKNKKSNQNQNLKAPNPDSFSALFAIKKLWAQRPSQHDNPAETTNGEIFPTRQEKEASICSHSLPAATRLNLFLLFCRRACSAKESRRPRHIRLQSWRGGGGGGCIFSFRYPIFLPDAVKCPGVGSLRSSLSKQL